MRNQPWHVFGADRFAAAISRALIERGERVILCAEDEGTRRDAGLFGIQAIHPDDAGEVARVLVTPACNRGHVAAILKTKPFPFTVEIKQERNPQDVRRIKPDIEWQVHGILDPLAPPRVEQVSEWVKGKVA